MNSPMKTVLISCIILSISCSAAISQIPKITKEYPDDPQAREEYEYLRLRDPATDELPEFIRQKEFEFAQKLPKKDPFAGKGSLQSVSEWRSIGPVNVCGRVQAIGIDILNEA